MRKITVVSALACVGAWVACSADHRPGAPGPVNCAGSLCTTSSPATTPGVPSALASITGTGSPSAAATSAASGQASLASSSPLSPSTVATTPLPDIDSGVAPTSSQTVDPTDLPAMCSPEGATGHLQMENLDRGLVAIRGSNANYVGWRMLGYEYTSDAARIAYNVYRDDALLATVTDSTNYLDASGAANAKYAVSLVVDDQECPRSASAAVWQQNYVSIPLEPPPGGTSPNGETYSYNTGTVRESSGSVNDGSPGDLDGDGAYELVVIWQPSNAQDNSKGGFTGPAYMDAYKLTGERLWRMNLGPNVRSGAHYTQFLVYDLDGDGKAEVAFRTAPGTKDGTGTYLSKGPAANDDDSIDYRDDDGYVLSGPEYLTVFNGLTGAELATVNFETARGSVDAWGDDYGNRVDRFLASVGFVSDEGGSGKGSGRPALLMARGYYTRATVNAWTWRDGSLKRIWTADSNTAGSSALVGQGAHSMAVADVDQDGAQEIIYGAAMIQSDGSYGCSSGLNHGDALHVADLVPSRAGLEVFMPHEDKAKPWWDVRQAEDCKIIHQAAETGKDNGRGVADDITASNPGAEFWSASDSALRSATSNATVGNSRPGQMNFAIWWDGDELRELEDGTAIYKGDGTQLLSCDSCMSNNHTKATPTLTADLFGDWREEIVWRTPNSSELRIYTTTAITERRIYTLMHDAQYRMQVTSEQTAYNQPPHPSFFLGDGMSAPPVPDIQVK